MEAWTSGARDKAVGSGRGKVDSRGSAKEAVYKETRLLQCDDGDSRECQHVQRCPIAAHAQVA